MFRWILIPALAIQLLCSSAHAVRVTGLGGEVGWSSHGQSWEFSAPFLYDPVDPVRGVTGGAFVDVEALDSRAVGLRAAISYSRRGASRYSADYLSLPLLVTWRKPGESAGLLVGAGPSAEILLGEAYDVPQISGVRTVNPTENLFNGFNIGGHAMVGVEWAHYGFSIRYYGDITSPLKQSISDIGLPKSVANSGVSVVFSVKHSLAPN